MTTQPGPSTPGAALQGSRCPGCSVTAYPAGTSCQRCGEPLVPSELSRDGVLWTWTVQRYSPKSPPYDVPAAGFAPFAVGYVELPEGIRVAAVIDADLDKLEIGMPLRIHAGSGVPHAEVAR